MILEENTVTSVLILFVKINAFTWPKVWRFLFVFGCLCMKENKRAKVQQKTREKRGWDDIDACLSMVGSTFRGSCLAHSFPMAQWADLIIDRTMAYKVHFLFKFSLFLQFPHSDLLLLNHNRGKILQLKCWWKGIKKGVSDVLVVGSTSVMC